MGLASAIIKQNVGENMFKSEIKTEIDDKLNSKTNNAHTVNLNKNYQVIEKIPLDSGLN